MPKLNRISLSRIRLRSKLVLLAAVPLLGLIVTSGLLVQTSVADRSQALEEQWEIKRIGLAADLADALVLERERVSRSDTNDLRIDDSRAVTDLALVAYEETVNDRPVLAADVLLLRAELEHVRADLGTFEEMLDGQRMSQVDTDGEDAATFALLDVIVEHAVSITAAAPGSLESEEANVNARAVQLLTDYNSSVRGELRAYVEINGAVNLTVADAARGEAFRLSGRVNQLEQQLTGLNSGDVAADFEALIESPSYDPIATVRERVSTNFLDRERAPVSAFLATATPFLTELVELREAQIAAVSSNAATNADRAVRDVSASVATMLIFVIVVSLLVIALFRSVRAPLLSLTAQSRDIAKNQLPNAVAQIRELGGDAEIEMPEPLIAESDDEIGELVDAFNQLHRTAIQLASEQAASRRTVSEMFVNLGRRNQKILMRLLASLEKLERNERDPEVLQELFRVDHLATRMRRNAESLLVLAGAKTSRSFGQAVPVGDVVRSALSEVEDYERVTVTDEANALINGKAVADMGHLLAELIENALMFSPPSTSVEVLIVRGPDGLMMSVGDRGIGLTTEELLANNQRILDAAKLTETPSRFLGLYVVGRLAHRHGLGVELLNGVPSGLVARIRVPEQLLEAIDVPEQLTDEVMVRHEPAPDVAIASPFVDTSSPAQERRSDDFVSPASAAAEPETEASLGFAAVESVGEVVTPIQEVSPFAEMDSLPNRPADTPVAQASTQSSPPIQDPGPAGYAPPAPAHRRAPAPVAQEPVHRAPAPVAHEPVGQAPAPTAGQPTPFSTARRQPLKPLAPVEKIAETEPMLATNAIESNRNLGSFQRAVADQPSPIDSDRSAERRRPIPGQADQPDGVAPVSPAAPVAAEPQPVNPSGFNATKRVPGASSLARRVSPTAPKPAASGVSESSGDTPKAAARFGASLAGFQRGVKRADESPAENLDPADDQSMPSITDTYGESQ